MAACRFARCEVCMGDAYRGSCRCHWTCICDDCELQRSETLCECRDCQRAALNNRLPRLPSWLLHEFLNNIEHPINIDSLCESILSYDRLSLENDFSFTELQIDEIQFYAENALFCSDTNLENARTSRSRSRSRSSHHERSVLSFGASDGLLALPNLQQGGA